MLLSSGIAVALLCYGFIGRAAERKPALIKSASVFVAEIGDDETVLASSLGTVEDLVGTVV